MNQQVKFHVLPVTKDIVRIWVTQGDNVVGTAEVTVIMPPLAPALAQGIATAMSQLWPGSALVRAEEGVLNALPPHPGGRTHPMVRK